MIKGNSSEGSGQKKQKPKDRRGNGMEDVQVQHRVTGVKSVRGVCTKIPC